MSSMLEKAKDYVRRERLKSFGVRFNSGVRALDLHFSPARELQDR
jgi:hypothetical protein